ncbi:M48 family metallopeptidase [Echinicola jeungdonensis]|uniref:M48 family metallopeptidase n=1 Tax=Echinicola jeungdonensis TaxID=709343 RepID=A0ABV5J8G6_9BACT
MVKHLLNDWYYRHAKRKFNTCIAESVKKFSNYSIPQDPPLVVKRMNKRWGSCTPKGRIILNPEVIKTPSKCIEYVVIHELCHLIHPNHSKAFYKLQSEIMPDWEKWKLRLEKALV